MSTPLRSLANTARLAEESQLLLKTCTHLVGAQTILAAQLENVTSMTQNPLELFQAFLT